MSRAKTLGELKQNGLQSVSVKDEMRANLIRKLQAREKLFPGIVGYDDTVIPQLINAILARHNLILLGLRGQAKSRIIRQLTLLLDESIPIIEGSEVNDNPFHQSQPTGARRLTCTETKRRSTGSVAIGASWKSWPRRMSPSRTSSATSIPSRPRKAATC